MFNQYYDLRSEKMLPPAGVFIDPFDNAAYNVKPHETLADFTKRVETSRAEKGHPAFYPQELKQLVIISLAESSNQRARDRYFEMKAAVPAASELISLAKNIAAQYRTRKGVPFQQRQERAAKCRGCALHKKHAVVNPVTLKAIGKMAGLKEVVESPAEKALGTCGMCGCGLQGKIKFSIVNVLAGIAPDQLTTLLTAYGRKAFDRCWILNEAVDDVNMLRLLSDKLKAAGTRAISFLTAYLSEREQAKKHGNN